MASAQKPVLPEGWTRAGTVRFGAFGMPLGRPPAGIAGASRTPRAEAPNLRARSEHAAAGASPALPGVGPVMLQRLLEAREQEPFGSLAAIDRRIKGVGPKTIEQWRPLLRFEYAEPEEPQPAPKAKAKRKARTKRL